MLPHSGSVDIQHYSWMQLESTRRSRVLASHSAQKNWNSRVQQRRSKVVRLASYRSLVVCVNWISTLPLSVLFPSSSADESDGSVNCMQLGDWLQGSAGGERCLLLREPFSCKFLCIGIKRAPPPMAQLKRYDSSSERTMRILTSKASAHKYACVLTLNVHTRISVLSFSSFPVLIYSCTLIYLLLVGFFFWAQTCSHIPPARFKKQGWV